MQGAPKNTNVKLSSLGAILQMRLKVQTWIAACSFLLIAILKNKWKLSHTLFDVLQILDTWIF